MISELFSNRKVHKVESSVDVSTFSSRGVICESICDGIEAHAFSSNILTTCAGCVEISERVNVVQKKKHSL